ncbi:MAG: hypothetical protein ACYDAY_08310 [Candidatus Dormibacteria bacterium]
MPSARDLLNRGTNLLPIGMIAIIAGSALPELPQEAGLRGAIDEIGIALIGLVGIIWFMKSRFQRSLVPILLVAGTLAFKIFALIIEDADDKGDDVGIASALILLLITSVVIYIRSKNLVTD